MRRDESHEARPGRRLLRRRRAWLALGLAVAALYATAQAAASTEAFEARLRARLGAALAARVGPAALGDVGVDWLFRVRAGPVELPPPGAGATLARIGQARARLSLVALLSGRLEPGLVELRDVRLSPGSRARGDLLAALRRGRDGDARHPPGAHALPELRVRGLVVDLPVHGRTIALGPYDLDARVRDGRAEATLRLPGGGRATLAAARTGEGWSARLRAAGVGPRAVPPSLRAESAFLAGGSLSAELEGEAAPDLSRASARVRIAATDVVLAGARVAPKPVGPLHGEASALVAWDASARRLSVREGKASVLDAIPLSFAGEVQAGPGLPFSVEVRGEAIDYRALVVALPATLAPPAAAPRPSGTFDAELELSGPLAAPAAWAVAARLDLGRMREAARRAPHPALRAPFEHHPDPGDPRRVILVGPANPDFVPIAELPEHVVRAVTTSEDAGFFAHAGFDFEELRNALAQGAEAGRLVRGGSTITQQLAKNLYLGPDRNFARKVREAAITVALEASLPKRRLLEIYLNVVEWGPSLWGIGPAARHWFGKDARALTPKEAAFLASILPSPVRYHAMFARGSPSEAWDQRVNALLLKMTEQGALSDEQLVEGLGAALSFAGG